MTREELFAEAKRIACEIAFRVGVIITDEEEEFYAREVMDNYDDAKPLGRQVMNVIAYDFMG